MVFKFSKLFNFIVLVFQTIYFLILNQMSFLNKARAFLRLKSRNNLVGMVFMNLVRPKVAAELELLLHKLSMLMVTWGCIFSHVRPFYERALSNLDRSMHRSLRVLVVHSSFIEWSHTTKNTASGHLDS